MRSRLEEDDELNQSNALIRKTRIRHIKMEQYDSANENNSEVDMIKEPNDTSLYTEDKSGNDELE